MPVLARNVRPEKKAAIYELFMLQTYVYPFSKMMMRVINLTEILENWNSIQGMNPSSMD